MSVRKIGGTVLMVVLAAIAAKAAFSYGVPAWVEAQAKSPEFAYRDLYAELGAKSKDHHNLVSYYASCVDSGTVGVTGRGIPIARDGVTRDCLDKTASWSEKQVLRVPFATIRNDIVSGEAQVYLRTRKQ